ncbi:MAG: cellulase family glycosylhydrolase [Archangiaceae bacterium]|nr:cellulase family glycosylhydrolase [Archangiaceae bacterium]
MTLCPPSSALRRLVLSALLVSAACVGVEQPPDTLGELEDPILRDGVGGATVLEGEKLVLTPANAGTPVVDAAASAQRALTFWSGSTATGTLSSRGAQRLVVRARRERACGEAPRMQVKVDGALQLDVFVTSTVFKQLALEEPFPDGAHAVSVSFVNDSTAGGCDINLLVDQVAFVGSAAPACTDGTVNDTAVGSKDRQLDYTGSWQRGSGADKYQGDDHWSDVTGSTFTLRFIGAQVKLYASKADHHGIAAVRVDEGTETLVDLYSPTRAEQVLVFSSPGLSLGAHALHLRVTGTRNPASTGAVVTTDRIDVGCASPAPTCTPSCARATCGAADGCGGTCETGSGCASAATGRFYVVGSDIIDPEGKKFFPVGANVGTQLNFDWKGDGMRHSDDALAWGWNTVRLTLACTTSASYTTRSTQGFAALLQRAQSFVNEYTAKKIVVIIECHDLTGTSTFEGKMLASGKTVRQEVDDFWVDARERYKSNPYVWFNAVNEPVWANNALWVQLQTHYRDLVRATGAENLFVADVMNMGNDARWDGALRVYDPTMGPVVATDQCNVVFALHAYGGLGGSPEHVTYFDAVRKAGLAMLIGEFGYTLTNTANPGAYVLNVKGATAAFEVAAAKGIGMLFWHATHGDGYSLKASGASFYGDGAPSANLSAPGQRLWDLGHARPDLGAFTGSLKASHCPSVQ